MIHSKEEIIRFLQSAKDRMEQEYGVMSIALFGSWARGDQAHESDIDLLVQFRNPTFSKWASLKIFLEHGLGRKVDLITQGSHLSERFLKHVNRAIVHV